MLNTLNASNIIFSRFLPPRNVNTFCAPRSSSFVASNRVVPVGWNVQRVVGHFDRAAPVVAEPPNLHVPGPLTDSVRPLPSLMFKLPEALMPHGKRVRAAHLDEIAARTLECCAHP